MTKEVQKWADRAMYAAEPIAAGGPKVTVLSMNSDPLGEIASTIMMYEGKIPKSLAEITDEQRRFYLADVFKAKRWAPMEFVNIHFLISGVTRAFTHQMVRQRTAAYAQESMRFAVKEDVPVGLPASLADTTDWKSWFDQCYSEMFPQYNPYDDIEMMMGSMPPIPGTGGNEQYKDLMTAKNQAERRVSLVREYAGKHASKEQLWRREWDEAVNDIASSYNGLVSAGMPAEDARGLLPTNLLTQIHYTTHLRGLYEHSGQRLCTQAQHEWKVVWAEILKALTDYGKTQHYKAAPYYSDDVSSAWQFEELAKVFKPICYQTGKCEFNSSADRYCSIKPRVNRMVELGIPPIHWGTGIDPASGAFIGINDEEWQNNHESARISQ